MEIVTFLLLLIIFPRVYSDCEKPAIANNVLVLYPDGGRRPITEQTMLELSCKPGHNHVRGDSTILCLDSEWKVIDGDSVRPAHLYRCAVKPCPVANPFNGFAEIKGKKVIYTCKKGFYLIGHKNASCQLNKEGNYIVSPRKPPECERETGEQLVRCVPPDLPNMLPGEISEYRVGDNLTFTCKRGFQLLGSPTLTCQATAAWSGDFPNCIEKPCPVHAPENGRAERNGTKIRYYCNKGFQLKGHKEAFCILTWQGDYVVKKFAECVAIPIPVPTEDSQFSACVLPEIPFLSQIKTEYVVGDYAMFTCIDGYKLVGVKYLTCGIGGTWNSEFPTCTVIQCSVPDIAHLLSARKVYNYSNVATFSCEHGYRLNGADKLTCSNDGPFCSVEEIPTEEPRTTVLQCVIPDIPSLLPKNGFYDIGDAVTFSCDYGYQLIGAQSLTCGNGGLWNEPLPHCSAVQCTLPDVSHLLVDGNKFKFGDNITLSCKHGYRLDGTNFTSCGANGNWIDVIPTCSKIFCKLPGIPHLRLLDSDDDINDRVFEIGDVIKTVNLTCEFQYVLKEPTDLSCTADGNWTGIFPQCVEKTCLVHAPDNGFVDLVNGVVHYSCKPGYHLVGDEEVECTMKNDKGDFIVVEELPKCKRDITSTRLRCQSPNIPYLIYDGNNYFSGDIATFSCQDGYQIHGNSILRCDFNGEWNGTIPTCVADGVVCRDPGDSKFSVRDDIISHRVGMSVVYKCEEGYELLDKANGGIIKCLPNGKWSAGRPICIPFGSKTCPEIPLDNNLRIDDHSERVHPDVYLPRDEVDLSCKEHFTTEHVTLTLMCNADGTWDSIFPVCTEMRPCHRPSVPSNGRIVELEDNSSQEFPIGFEINLECDENYETQNGVYGTICIGNKWKDNLQDCTLITCSDPGMADHGSRTGNDFHVGSKVTFTCHGNYQLLGSQERECLFTGRWSGSTTICYINENDCIDPGIPTNSYRQGKRFHFGSIVEYTCKTGYTLIGNGTRKCLSSGQWSGDEISCVGQNEYSDPKDLKKLLKNLSEVAVISSSVSGVNVIFLWDGSASINNYYFEWSRRFIKSVIRRLNATREPSVLHVGVIFFSSSASKLFNSDLKDVNNVIHLMDEVKRKETGTNIVAALLELDNLLRDINRELRSKKSTTDVFILTDGRANEGGHAFGKIDDLREKYDITFHVVAIGAEINKPLLNNISSHGFLFSNRHKLLKSDHDAQKDTEKKLYIDDDYTACGVDDFVGTGLKSTSVDFDNLPTKHPWLVAFYFNASDYHKTMADIWRLNHRVRCDGIIIHQKWIMSAASCFNSTYRTEHQLLSSAENWRVITGKPNVFQNIKRIIIHTFINIALIEVTMPFSFDVHVRPACLPSLTEGESPYQTAVITNWTHDSKLKLAENIQEFNFSIKNEFECRVGFNNSVWCVMYQRGFCNLVKETICVENGEGKFNLCSVGDEMVPLMRKFAVNSNADIQSRWFVTGIRNLAVHCKSSDQIFYTSVAKMRDWIVSKTQVEFENVQVTK